ncbi:MAG: hypothetical protein JWO62_2410 [Acidimicrobiaceae bacterium]|nr:hypothetical protein [Acidimicrobiaceae bacterium]
MTAHLYTGIGASDAVRVVDHARGEPQDSPLHMVEGLQGSGLALERIGCKLATRHGGHSQSKVTGPRNRTGPKCSTYAGDRRSKAVWRRIDACRLPMWSSIRQTWRSSTSSAATPAGRSATSAPESGCPPRRSHGASPVSNEPASSSAIRPGSTTRNLVGRSKPSPSCALLAAPESTPSHASLMTSPR